MENESKVCPFCGENIKKIAIKCRYCHESLELVSSDDTIEEENNNLKEDKSTGFNNGSDIGLLDNSIETESSGFIKIPWVIATALVVGLFIVFIKNRQNLEPVFYFQFGTMGFVLGYLGQAIGRVFRDIASPDIVMGNDGYELLKARLFWKIGPQFIGIIAGCIGALVIWSNYLK